jgi:hypothetical protein
MQGHQQGRKSSLPSMKVRGEQVARSLMDSRLFASISIDYGISSRLSSRLTDVADCDKHAHAVIPWYGFDQESIQSIGHVSQKVLPMPIVTSHEKILLIKLRLAPGARVPTLSTPALVTEYEKPRSGDVVSRGT